VIVRVIVRLLVHLRITSGTTRTGIAAVRALDPRPFRVRISSYGKYGTPLDRMDSRSSRATRAVPSSILGRCANADRSRHVMPHIHHAHRETSQVCITLLDAEFSGLPNSPARVSAPSPCLQYWHCLTVRFVEPINAQYVLARMAATTPDAQSTSVTKLCIMPFLLIEFLYLGDTNGTYVGPIPSCHTHFPISRVLQQIPPPHLPHTRGKIGSTQGFHVVRWV
jgi:hypothetical protein